jgi:hypothetical protein
MTSLTNTAKIVEHQALSGHKEMNIEIMLELSEDDVKEISVILDCPEGDLQQELAKHIRAAANEYLSMYRGQKVFRRVSDIHEFRLLLLIESRFCGRIPDEREVTRLFQTTPSESRALIRSVLAKYQHRIKAGILETIKNALERASQPVGGGDYEVTINSRNIVDEMNRLLAGRDGSLHQVKRKRDSVSTYEIKPSSFNSLAREVGMQEGVNK